jgi:hypothetical protein
MEAVPDGLVEQQVHIDCEHKKWRERCESQLHVLLTERQWVDAEVNGQISKDGVAIDADGGALVILRGEKERTQQTKQETMNFIQPMILI